jgi:hypothetical protein
LSLAIEAGVLNDGERVHLLLSGGPVRELVGTLHETEVGWEVVSLDEGFPTIPFLPENVSVIEVF